MNIYIKQSIIIIVILILILWLQYTDDKKYNIKRNTYYSIYKFPLFVCALVGLFLNFDLNNHQINNLNEQEIFVEPLHF